MRSNDRRSERFDELQDTIRKYKKKEKNKKDKQKRK
jgi:hypothetical protein